MGERGSEISTVSYGPCSRRAKEKKRQCSNTRFPLLEYWLLTFLVCLIWNSSCCTSGGESDNYRGGRQVPRQGGTTMPGGKASLCVLTDGGTRRAVMRTTPISALSGGRKTEERNFPHGPLPSLGAGNTKLFFRPNSP